MWFWNPAPLSLSRLKAARAAVIVGALSLAGALRAEVPLIDHIVVHKAAREMVLYADGAAVHTITGIQLGDNPDGAKRYQGDERTPEGSYTIDYGNPQSSYHLSLHISYPDAEDTAYAAAHGRSAGGMIFIHGQPNSRTTGRELGDWTDGCIAVSNAEMELLWETVGDGTPIDIMP